MLPFTVKCFVETTCRSFRKQHRTRVWRLPVDFQLHSPLVLSVLISYFVEEVDFGRATNYLNSQNLSSFWNSSHTADGDVNESEEK